MRMRPFLIGVVIAVCTLPLHSSSAATTAGAATGAGNTVELGWGIALWDDEDQGKLIIGLMQSKPSDEDIARIIETKSLFMSLYRLDDPMLEFQIYFDASGGTANIAKPRSRTALFVNFDDKGPMTLSRSVGHADGDIKLQGTLQPGGLVQGRIVGSDKFEVGDDRRTYQWDVAIELPVR